MSATRDEDPCGQAERLAAYAVLALPATESAEFEAHLMACGHCHAELGRIRPVVDAFVAWPGADVLRPDASLQERLARRIAQDSGTAPVAPPPATWREPEWEEVAPGIFCKLLANDAARRRVSMLVKLLPNVEYPPHSHAGLEELHLLEGELWIDDRKLSPGDYNRARAPSGDKRVWSETGCTCVLITSTEDVLA